VRAVLAVQRARVLLKNENVNWLEDGFTMQSKKAKAPHSDITAFKCKRQT
jgi:hypothetical protein